MKTTTKHLDLTLGVFFIKSLPHLSDKYNITKGAQYAVIFSRLNTLHVHWVHRQKHRGNEHNDRVYPV